MLDNCGMAILLDLIGYLLFGTIGVLILVIGGVLFLFAGPRTRPILELCMYKAKPGEVAEDTQLFSIVEAYARGAGST